MAAVITVIAGRYSATYNSVDVGITAEPGYKLSFTYDLENVEKTDAWASNVIEQIYLGVSRMSLDFISKEYKAGPLTSVSPFTSWAPTGAQTFSSGLVGRRATDLALACVMTSTASTPAASTPATMTFTYAIMHEGVPVDLLFGPRVRNVPVRYRILPYANSGAATYFTAT